MVCISIEELLDMEGTRLSEYDIKMILHHAMHKQRIDPYTMTRIFFESMLERPDGYWKKQGRRELQKFIKGHMDSYIDSCEDTSFP